ncbi:MAG TPA: sulfur carrier protein ThiS [Eoetvoesiella sp.]
MNITLNGNSKHFKDISTVADLIAVLGYQGKRIAVERNGEIVPKSQHADAALSENDQIEIVVAVGGG